MPHHLKNVRSRLYKTFHENERYHINKGESDKGNPVVLLCQLLHPVVLLCQLLHLLITVSVNNSEQWFSNSFGFWNITTRFDQRGEVCSENKSISFYFQNIILIFSTEKICMLLRINIYLKLNVLKYAFIVLLYFHNYKVTF